MTDLILTDQQIEALTKRKRFSAQARALSFLGIPYRPRADGSLVVCVDDLKPTEPTPPRRTVEPNWQALDAKAETKRKRRTA